MLVGSGVRNGGSPMRVLGGAQAMTVERWGWEQRGATLNLYGGEGTVIGGASIANWLGTPSGYLSPGAWSLPIKPGGMTSRNRIGGTATVTATAQAAYPMAGSLSGTLTVDATAALVATAVATITAAASLVASASGGAAGSAALSASSSLSAAIGAIASKAAELTGSASIAATLTALGSMECDIAQTAEAINPDTIAAAVWAHGSAISLVAAVDLIRQISDNRLEVDITGQRLVLYADDGTTELRAWALATDGGEDVATATGVQTKRGAGA